jgi:hypothetical protein
MRVCACALLNLHPTPSTLHPTPYRRLIEGARSHGQGGQQRPRKPAGDRSSYTFQVKLSPVRERALSLTERERDIAVLPWTTVMRKPGVVT